MPTIRLGTFIDMLSPVNNDLTGLVFETHRNKAELNDSLSKLSSGRRIVNPGEDSGSHSQVAKIGSKHKRDIANLQNLQNLVSYLFNLTGLIKLFFDTVDLCNFVINEFNPTFEAQGHGNGAFKKYSILKRL